MIINLKMVKAKNKNDLIGFCFYFRMGENNLEKVVSHTKVRNIFGDAIHLY